MASSSGRKCLLVTHPSLSPPALLIPCARARVQKALMDVVQRVVGAQESVVGQGEAEGVAIAFINSPIEGFNLTVSRVLCRV